MSVSTPRPGTPGRCRGNRGAGAGSPAARSRTPGRRCGSTTPSGSAHLPRAPPAGSRARRRTPPVPGASSNSSQSARTSTPQGPPTTTSRRSNAASKGPVTSAVSSTDGPTTPAPSPYLRATARSGRPRPPVARRASRSPQRPRRWRAQRRGHHERHPGFSGQARSPTRQLGVAAGAARAGRRRPGRAAIVSGGAGLDVAGMRCPVPAPAHWLRTVWQPGDWRHARSRRRDRRTTRENGRTPSRLTAPEIAFSTAADEAHGAFAWRRARRARAPLGAAKKVSR
jgi:hypothetical protein